MTMLYGIDKSSGGLVQITRAQLFKNLVEIEAVRQKRKALESMTMDQRVDAIVREERQRVADERAAKIARCTTPAAAATLRRAFAAVDSCERVLAGPPPEPMTPFKLQQTKEAKAKALALLAKLKREDEAKKAQAAAVKARALAAVAKAEKYARQVEREAAARTAADVIDDSIRAREIWTEKVVCQLVPRLALLGIKQPDGEAPRKIRCSVVPLHRRRGQCHHAMESPTGKTNLIILAIDQTDPIEAIHTTCHEILHALDGCESENGGHGGRWAKWAEKLGMRYDMHERSTATDAMFRDVLRQVGPMP